ncbi:hypothetical protein STSP2_01873 [Anaerohalosphaera lusitana]|uniref:PEGA domain-containing protein n=1 Tax=Anaerohalosphaera lusitana TaxID=1936003 RepID=A0A1U9NL89_9BACT|nr:hypothetical protein [Anaerohalosphaera lusitana]AQT68701.1 hypothetical protein STSP2_01873 [Anaerohalosphaera lusitana]
MNPAYHMTVEQAKSLLEINTNDLLIAEDAYKKLRRKLQNRLNMPGTTPEQREETIDKLSQIARAIDTIRQTAASQNSTSGASQQPPNFANSTPPQPKPFSSGNVQPTPTQSYYPHRSTPSSGWGQFVSFCQTAGFILHMLFKFIWVPTVFISQQLARLFAGISNSIRYSAVCNVLACISLISVSLAGVGSVVLMLAMKVPTAQVRVLAVPWCHVSVDGEELGVSGQAEPFYLREGEHVLELRTDTGQTLDKHITLSRHSETIIRANFQNETVTISGGHNNVNKSQNSGL